MKRFYFLGGLPRAGSTLLCNILNQNPDFHATATSGCMDTMFCIRNQWHNLIEHKASPNEEAFQRVLNGIINNYYADVEKPIIVDKCRGWVSLIEMAELALGHKIKILVPVRDYRDVLASFEVLWRKQTHKGQIPGERENYMQFQTVAGRCAFWSRDDQPCGLAHNRIKDAIARGFSDRMLFVHFEKLTSQPFKTMKMVYEFLGEPDFKHDFTNVEQVTQEDDKVFGFDGLHTIRNKVEPIPPRYPSVLGKVAERYVDSSFWNNQIKG